MKALLNPRLWVPLLTLMGGVLTASPASAQVNVIVNDPIENEDLGNLQFAIIARNTGNAVSAAGGVTLTVSNGTAVAGGMGPGQSDYQPLSGDFAIPALQPNDNAPGGPDEYILPTPVTVFVDQDLEPDETVIGTLSNPINVNISDAQGTGTIVNDDDPPILDFGDAPSAPEGNVGTTNRVFNVTLSAGTFQEVRVNYTTIAGSATSANPNPDYTATSGELVFPPYTLTQQITVPVNGDLVFEPDENFLVRMVGMPTNAVIGDDTGATLILNDDNPPTLSIADAASVNEGNVGTTNRTFTVTLSNPSAQEVRVDYATISQTASSAAANADFVAANGTLIFAPLTTSQNITVQVNGDTLFELDETFIVQLSNPVNVTVTDGQAITTIVNDDTAPTFSISDGVECEDDGSITFTVTLSAPSGVDTTVDFTTVNISASAGSDYAAQNGTLVFPKGEVSRTITVTILDDGVLEPNETFNVLLSNPQPLGSATFADSTGTGTIQDNDGVNTIILENIGTDGTVINGTGGPVQRFRATATNGCGDPAAGVPLEFEVSGATGSNQVVTIITDQDGEAIFEYTPLFPGQDTVTVSDPAEGAVATPQSTDVNITVASNTVNGQAAGAGNIQVEDGVAFFSLDVNTNRNGKAKGSVQATFPSLFSNLKSTKILGLVIGEPASGGRAAVIFGIGKAKGVPGKFTFRVDVLDNGTPGVPNDRFLITILNDGDSDSVGGALKFERRGILNDIRVRTP